MTPDYPARLRALRDGVEAMNDATNQALSWASPGGCGVGQYRNGSCQHEACWARAGHYAGYWARLSAHEANLLAALLTGEARKEQP